MNYQEIMEKFAGLRVMIIGDVMIDSYVWGKVERISPEAPVPIVAVNRHEDRLGGAANVALNVSALGAKPVLCSVVGEDPVCDILLELMKNENMPTDGIMACKDRVTTLKRRVLGNTAQMLRIDEEITTPLSGEEEKLFLERIISIIRTEPIDVIIFQDYDKGVLTPYIIENVVTEAKKHGIFTTVDPKKRNFGEYKHVTLFKPNLKELKEGLKIDFDSLSEDNLNDAANLLYAKQRMDMIFITLSEHGVYLYDRREGEVKTYRHPAEPRNIADVSGAGDTVISVASLALAAGATSEQFAKMSNLAGGIVCEYVGVVPIDKSRFMAELKILDEKTVR